MKPIKDLYHVFCWFYWVYMIRRWFMILFIFKEANQSAVKRQEVLLFWICINQNLVILYPIFILKVSKYSAQVLEQFFFLNFTFFYFIVLVDLYLCLEVFFWIFWCTRHHQIKKNVLSWININVESFLKIVVNIQYLAFNTF